MKGGQTFFKGSAGEAARRYLEQDSAFAASDYYTEHQNLLATRTAFGADGQVLDVQLLSPEDYQGWVEWADPRTGELRGKPRSRVNPQSGKKEGSVLFIDKSVNAPKTLSILAAIDPEFASILERAMGKAAHELGKYQAENFHSRIMRKGKSYWEPAQQLETATVVHKTSREGDPFWHIHLQTLNRVKIGDKWRALDTKEAQKHNATLNALGTAIIGADQELRTYLHKAGYHLNAEGEIQELEPYKQAFSKRNQQIQARKAQLLELWAKENPGVTPGTKIMGQIDHLAWAQTRNEKTQETSANPNRWASELEALGFVAPAGVSVVDDELLAPLENELVDEKLLTHFSDVVAGRLAENFSGWSVAQVRAEALKLISEIDMSAEVQEILSLAERITSQVVGSCQVLAADIDPMSAPTHLPVLTNSTVLETEQALFDTASALVARTTSYQLALSPYGKPKETGAHYQLSEEEMGLIFSSRNLRDVHGQVLSLPTDEGHRQALAAMGGSAQLVVVTGPAGAGKTTLLKASQAIVELRGGRQFIVAPSAQAAKVAKEETGAKTGTAHSLLAAFGYKAEEKQGITTWSEPGADHKVPRDWALRPGDQLVVDEAGMLTQDVAVRLQEIALKTGAQLVLTGDYAQLSAVGRGGVLQKASSVANAVVDLSSVWRFRTAEGQIDEDYARLSLKLRARSEASEVFDELVARGLVVLHESEERAVEALANTWLEAKAEGRRSVVAASTNATVEAINAQVAADYPKPESSETTAGMGGVSIGAGDIIKTRKNNRQLGVLNGQHFVVRSISSEGGIRVQSLEADRSVLELPAEYVSEHVQLGYATTVHSSQGMTVDEGHLLVTGQTDGAGVYVGLSRGKTSNVAHFVADSLEEAREQFVAAVGRARADMGLEAHQAELEAMLVGTEYEQKQSENYPVMGLFNELEPGDGFMYQGQKHLVVAADWEKHVLEVINPAEGAEASVKKLRIAADGQEAYQPITLTAGGPLPAPKVVREAKEQALAKVERAKELKSFLLASDVWQKNLEEQPQLLGDLVGAYQRQEQLTGVVGQAQGALELARGAYETDVWVYERKVRAAEKALEQIRQEREQMGRIKRAFTSNGPLREAERNLEQVRESEPSGQKVREAEARLEEARVALEQVTGQLESLSKQIGRAPVADGVCGASVGAAGLVGVDRQSVELEILKLTGEAESLVTVSEGQEYLGAVWAQQAKEQERKESSGKPVASRPVVRRRKPAAVQAQNLPVHPVPGFGQDMGFSL